jgi:wyosine [tRNA(Phe)-imidazoG37] synthetase (radical SAM superfamily)
MMALQPIVYGPVRSRRLGVSLGLNVLPADRKLCNFNCAYCQYGWTPADVLAGRTPAESFPPRRAITSALAAWLSRAGATGERIDRLTLAGHGEPTLHPDFAGIVSDLVELRDDLMPAARLAILSNSSRVDVPEVRRALGRLDERYMKLDAGDQAMLRRLNGTSIGLESLVEGLCALGRSTIQTLFVRDRSGRIDNSTDVHVAAWMATLARIGPESVHVYTIDRSPAFPFLDPVPAARLQQIGAAVRAAGMDVSVFTDADTEQLKS